MTCPGRPPRSCPDTPPTATFSSSMVCTSSFPECQSLPQQAKGTPVGWPFPRNLPRLYGAVTHLKQRGTEGFLVRPCRDQLLPLPGQVDRVPCQVVLENIERFKRLPRKNLPFLSRSCLKCISGIHYKVRRFISGKRSSL